MISTSGFQEVVGGKVEWTGFGRERKEKNQKDSSGNSFKEFCCEGEQRCRMDAGGRNELKRGTPRPPDITACLQADGKDQ